MFARLKQMRLPFPAFLRREDGTATVEAVLWFPIFIAVFGLMVDSSIIFNGQTKVLRVVQDANRRLSINSLKSDAQVEAYITAELAVYGITPSTVDAQTDATTHVVSTVVVVPASQLQLLGYFSVLTNLQIPVTSQHMLENYGV